MAIVGHVDANGNVTSTEVSDSAWRAWSEQASPELLERFQRQAHDSVQEARRKYPALMAFSDPAYAEMKSECTRALDLLCLRLDQENDDALD